MPHLDYSSQATTPISTKGRLADPPNRHAEISRGLVRADRARNARIRLLWVRSAATKSATVGVFKTAPPAFCFPMGRVEAPLSTAAPIDWNGDGILARDGDGHVDDNHAVPGRLTQDVNFDGVISTEV